MLDVSAFFYKFFRLSLGARDGSDFLPEFHS